MRIAVDEEDSSPTQGRISSCAGERLRRVLSKESNESIGLVGWLVGLVGGLAGKADCW